MVRRRRVFGLGFVPPAFAHAGMEVRLGRRNGRAPLVRARGFISLVYSATSTASVVVVSDGRGCVSDRRRCTDVLVKANVLV